MNINKIFYLSTCSTCKEIIKLIKDLESFELIDIKKQTISLEELDDLYRKTKSYEALFSKKARNYGAIKSKLQSDEDYKEFILQDYTFLKRPVIIYKDLVFIGNEKATKEKIKAVLG